MAQPLVSIVIPVYNQRKYIAQAVDSALSQTYARCEVVVHDNCSTDGTDEILKGYGREIRLYRSAHNRGMVSGWNHAIRYAEGEFIKFLASDDLIDPGCVQSLVSALQSHPGSALAACRRRFIDSTGRVIKTMGFANGDRESDGKEYVRDFLSHVRENKIGEPTAVLYRKELIERAGEYDPQFSQFADTEYWLRLLLHGSILYVDTPLCSFRQHDSSNSSKAIHDGRYISETFALIRKYYHDAKYRQELGLDRRGEDAVIDTKILDSLKNSKDCLKEGKISQGIRYVRLLIRAVGLKRTSAALFSYMYRK